MEWRNTHADWALLPRGEFPKRPNINLRADIELASSLIKFLLDELAFFFMFPPVFVLTFLVAIPNALAGPALHQSITFLPASRTHVLGWGGPIFHFRFGIIILPFHRSAKRQRTELLGSHRCAILFG